MALERGKIERAQLAAHPREGAAKIGRMIDQYVTMLRVGERSSRALASLHLPQHSRRIAFWAFAAARSDGLASARASSSARSALPRATHER